MYGRANEIMDRPESRGQLDSSEEDTKDIFVSDRPTDEPTDWWAKKVSFRAIESRVHDLKQRNGEMRWDTDWLKKTKKESVAEI